MSVNVQNDNKKETISLKDKAKQIHLVLDIDQTLALQAYKDRQYYLDGFFELQKVNSQLEFYGGEFAKNFFGNQNTILSRKKIGT